MTGHHLLDSQIGIALGMHKAGASQRKIAAQLRVTQSTISRLLRRATIGTFRKRGPRRQYKRLTNNRDNRHLTRLALKLRRISLSDLKSQSGLKISKTTIARHLKEVSIRKRVARTKPHLTDNHKSNTSSVGKGTFTLDSERLG